MIFEQRDFKGEVILREAQEGSDDLGVIEGHAAVFNTLSLDLGGYKERIDPNAFVDVMDNDVRALFNHDANFLLGRSKAGTLRLTTDNIGLHYSIDLPNNTAGRDAKESISRGDIDGNSFKFTILDSVWTEEEDGTVIRTITKVGRLVDVGPVVFPAYPDAKIAQRSLEEYKQTKYKPNPAFKDKLSRLSLGLK